LPIASARACERGIQMNDENKSEDSKMVVAKLVLAAAIAVYFLWILLFAEGERPSTLLTVIYWVAVASNVVYIAATLLTRRK